MCLSRLSSNSIGKISIIKVEEPLKGAFNEFYQKLRLLKSYGFLNNTLAFSEIMKKYDKVSSINTLKPYMNMVDNSFLGSSADVTKLMERVQTTFIKQFSNSNCRKGMAVSRPEPKIVRHRITFFMGNCTVALTLALLLIVRASGIMNQSGTTQYMDNIFPLYSLFGFIVLHMLMYAGNIYFWRRWTPQTKDYKALTELLPLFLVLIVVVILLCPFDIVYRSSRYFFLVCVFHCICAPLYKVKLPDFFLADQLPSQVQAIRSLEFNICYYSWGDYKHRETSCRSSDVFNTFSFIVACIPYWSCLLQCIRRLFEEKDPYQGYNRLKYFFTIVAVSMRTAYSLNKETNSWLRDKLLIPYKSVYFGAMVLNVLLRFAWLQTVLGINISSMHRQTMIAVVASLEIIRRGIWRFFRLVNEHLNNNVGKYRAFKSVTLPFNYDEELKTTNMCSVGLDVSYKHR
ncbi:hypothetical protein M0R45_028672 [Rubus argutus]|uniref:Uncharacterized protein n=1 Tax=Rubus argutus TaxID=59490 RepID=A0AAW1W8B7_RUBAR